MKLDKKIKREERQLNNYKKARKVGIIITIIGVITCLTAFFFNVLKLFESTYDGASQNQIVFAIIFFVIKTVISTNLFRVGLFLTIMFSKFINKKNLNIETYNKKLNYNDN